MPTTIRSADIVRLPSKPWRLSQPCGRLRESLSTSSTAAAQFGTVGQNTKAGTHKMQQPTNPSGSRYFVDLRLIIQDEQGNTSVAEHYYSSGIYSNDVATGLFNAAREAARLSD